MLDSLEAEVRGRLGDAIYGQDGQTLEGIVLELLAQRGWRLATIEAGTHGLLAAGLSAEDGPYVGGRLLPTGLESVRLRKMMEDERATAEVEVCGRPPAANRAGECPAAQDDGGRASDCGGRSARA